MPPPPFLPSSPSVPLRSPFLPLPCDWLRQGDERGRIWDLNWGAELVIISPPLAHTLLPQGTVTLTVISVQKCHSPIMPWALISICAYPLCPITTHLQPAQRDKRSPLSRSATIKLPPSELYRRDGERPGGPTDHSCVQNIKTMSFLPLPSPASLDLLQIYF